MSTIDSPKIIEIIILNRGVYPGDPPSHSVWAYWSTLKKGTTFKVFDYRGFLAESQFVRNPVLLWDKHGGLTVEGNKFLENPETYSITINDTD